jgi:hypothetical protein
MLFQVEIRTLSGIGLQTMCFFILAKNLPTFCACSETLCKAKFKGDGLINLVEQISRWHSMQAVTLILLAAFLPDLQ